MKKAAILILFATLLFGCKKRLKNDAEILVGEWEWIYTEAYNGSMGNPITFYLTPASEGETYSLLLEKKGKATLYKDGEEVRKSRITYRSVEYDPLNGNDLWWTFTIVLKGDGDELEMRGYFKEFEPDTMYIKRWPIESGGVSVEANVFVRK